MLRNQDIGRLDIAVQDSGGVRGRQSVGYAGQQLHRLTPPALLLFGPRLECPAVHELGHQVLPALEIASVVDGQDVRVVERGGHLCLSLKAAARRGVGQLRRKELDRHRPVELGVDGTKYLTHAANAQKSLNLVSSYLNAGGDHGHWRIRAASPARPPGAGRSTPRLR